MTEPIVDSEQAPDVSLAVETVKALVANAKDLGLTWNLRPGVVAVDSGLIVSNVSISMDGDTVLVTAVSLVGPLLEGQRVMVMSVPPGGLFVVGSAGMDQWHEVGGTNGPLFNTNWSSFGDPFGDVGYRRTLDGHLEMTGLADFASTSTAPALIFTLPEGWRPDRTVQFIASNNPGPGVAPTPRSIQINALGEVYATNFAGTIDPGPISFDGIYFALRTGL